jgi:hypothetical protein
MATVNDDYPTSKKQKPMSDAELKAIAIAKHESKPSEEKSESKFPTEIIQLPSKGKYYPKGHPLKSGTVEMKYMTAREEDILTNQSYIRQGVVLDKLFKALLVTDFNYNDLLLGDKNAIMVAARILGYGKEYEFEAQTPSGNKQTITVDLTQLQDLEIDWDSVKDDNDTLTLTLPASKRSVVVRLMTHGLQKKIDHENKALAKLKKDGSITTMLKHMIVAVDGDSEAKTIRHFVDNELFAIDSRYIRNQVTKVTPDINMEIDAVDEEDGDPFQCKVSFGLDFFWPDSSL